MLKKELSRVAPDYRRMVAAAENCRSEILPLYEHNVSCKIIDELAGEYEGRVTIGKCDVDSNNAIAVQYAVRNIPTILFIKNGQIVDKQIGAAPKNVFAEKIAKLL